MKNRNPKIFAAAAFIVFLVPAFAAAATIQEQIDALLLQVQALTKLIAAMPAASSVTVTALPSIARELAPGATGQDVRTLQTFLSKDKEIYPEGLVTGYFGTLTRRAVLRYQEVHDLTPVGAVDSSTIRELNADIMAVNNQAAATASAPVAPVAPVPTPPITPVPPVAPTTTPVAPSTTIIVPPVAAAPATTTPTSTGETTTATTTPAVPVPALSTSSVQNGELSITNVVVSVTDTSATVSWSTNLPATSVVDYDTLPRRWYFVYDPTLSMGHRITVSGLVPGTLYYFDVQSLDSNTVQAVAPGTFTTTGTPPVPAAATTTSN